MDRAQSGQENGKMEKMEKNGKKWNKMEQNGKKWKKMEQNE